MGWRRTVVASLAYAAAYAGALWLGYEFLIDAVGASALWPPAGLSVAVFVRARPRHWPRLVALTFAAGTAAERWVAHIGWADAIGLTAPAALEPLIVAGALRLTAFDPALPTLRDLMRLAAVALFVGSPAAALVGAAVVVHQHPGAPFLGTLETWSLGDALGILLVAPALLLPRPRVATPVALAEGAVLLALSVALGLAHAGTSAPTAVAYVAAPLVIVAGYRRGVAGAAYTALACSSGAIAGVLSTSGPATTPALHDDLVAVQAFGFVSFGVLLAAAAWSEQRERDRRAVASEQALVAELRARNAEAEQFVYAVSHDLKTPLVTIRGFVGAIDDELAGDPAARARYGADLARIDQAASRMHELLDDLLELSRVGWSRARMVPVPLGEVVADALARAEGELARHKVAVVVADGLPTVDGDRGRLVQAVQNLVENAAKYMGEQAAPRVEIGVRADAELAILAVADNGLGVAPEHAERIFRLFEKLDKRSPGSGVGLALVRRIADLHGGRAWVESAGPGRGSTFLLALRREAPLAADPTPDVTI